MKALFQGNPAETKVYIDGTPDLAKFWNFGEFLSVGWILKKVHLVFGPNFEPTLAILFQFG